MVPGARILQALICIAAVVAIHSLCYADSAEVLPKGVFRADVSYSYYNTVNDRFDPDGDEEAVATDFNATLGSNIFPALEALEDAFPGLAANLGDSVVDFDYEFDDLIFSLKYGLTDKLTVGVKIPYYWNRNSVTASLDTRNATVGKNPLFGQGADPFGVPLIPIAFGGVPLTTEDVLRLVSEEFGYDRFESWDKNGFADIEAGFRYQYLKTDDWRLAFTGGVSIPTGDVNDPDNLQDIAFGSGAWALLFQFNNDYTGIENVVLNASVKYDLVLPDKEEQRVLLDVNRPLVGVENKEDVDRNLGDVIELETSADYALSKTFNISVLYKFTYKFEDEISGDRDLRYESLEDETEQTSHTVIAGISYSTVPLYAEKKFPVPLQVSLEYEDVFAGKNNFLEQELISVKFAAYF